MNSLRSRLLLILPAILALVLGVGGWVAHSVVKVKLYEEFDSDLASRVEALTAFIDKDEGEIAIDWLDLELLHPPGGDPGNEFVQIWNGEGEVIYQSAGLADGPLPKLDGTVDQPSFRELGVSSSKTGRAAGITFTAEVDEDDIEEETAAGFDVAPESVRLTVAHVDTVSPMLASLRYLFILLWCGGTLVGGALIWLNIRSALRPLDALREQICQLRDGTRKDGVDLKNPPAELAPVTEELNRLIDQLERAIVRERSLTSNVAHELRTPIAGLLSTLEVTLSRERGASEYREANEDSFEIAKRMHWLVNNLLSMTRIESGTVEISHHMVELEPSLKGWWGDFAERAGEKQIVVDWKLAPNARLETDPEFLRIVVTNLYDNAVSYTPDGGTITVATDGQGKISVGNDAIDLSSGDAEKMFEPFWREDESRNEIGTHAGLGLALCHKIVSLLGGDIKATVAETGERFEMTVNLARP